MQQLVLILHIIVAACLIALVLVQHGKGAEMGASFGSGASNTMFGSVGPASFLMKLTSTLAAVFFVTSILLGYLVSKEVMQQRSFSAPATQPAPAAPQTPTPDSSSTSQ